MNLKRYILACLGVYIGVQATDPVIHGLILGKDYQALSHIWRPDMMDKMWIMFISTAIFSLFFVYIFIKGREGKGVMEGLRYGIIVGLLMNGVGLLSQYVVYPVPFELVSKWFVFSMIQFILYGIIAALIYKPVISS